MVSKAAVIALVAIVACPILLGYGLNLEQATHTDYGVSKDPVDVTGLLSNGVYYNDVYADIYKLNTSITTGGSGQATHIPVMPLYQQSTAASSALPFNLYKMTNWSGGDWGLVDTNLLYMIFDYTFSSGSISMRFLDSSFQDLTSSVSGVTYFIYDDSTHTVNYSYFRSDGLGIIDGTFTSENLAYLRITPSGFSAINGYWGRQVSPLANNTNYVDFAAGFRLHMGESWIDLPDYTKNYIMTINLDSMTLANDTIRFYVGLTNFAIIKTTTNGVVQYYYQGQGGTQTPIYHDPNRNDNTYQLYFELTPKGMGSDGYYHYNHHFELRYVGSWPTIIGEAQYYQKYVYDNDQPRSSLYFLGVEYIHVQVHGGPIPGSDNYSPIMRMDSAVFTGMLMNTIFDQTYDPAAFKTNPHTTITNIRMYGDSLTFGGTTYQVKDGNITIGNRDFSIRKLVFESIPKAGGYENTINGVPISTTAAPSTIRFGGQWSAQVVTDSMESTTYTSTDWTPGEFAWDGIDTNFLIVALFTTLCVFIGVGIYMRRSKAALLPLLIVCGCAVGLFVAMI